MLNKFIGTIFILFNLTYAQPDSNFTPISGNIGESAQWGSGWIDIDKVMSFEKGTTLKIEVGGSAQKVIVRLLEKGKTPDMAVGIIGKFDVPQNRVFKVKLDNDYKNIWQISVHGTSRAWNYDLGANNGSASIRNIEFQLATTTSSADSNYTVVKAADFTTITGNIGESAQWGSGWIDIDQLISFKKGTTLKIEVGGSAEKVIVRLLEKGKTPDMPTGITGKYEVPQNKIICIVLNKDFKDIWQISVHGTSRAWNYELGATNGPATLVQVQWK